MPVAAHFTRLDDFRAAAEGVVTIILSGGDLPEESFTIDAPSIPGILRPVAAPRRAGERQLTVWLQGKDLDSHHDLGSVTVYPDAAAASAARSAVAEEDEGGIPYLKEQQWQVDFAIAKVALRTLRVSVPATATVRPRADGEAFLSAPTAGHLRAAGETFPHIGMPVKAGQILSHIIPHLGAETDVASLDLALSKTRAALGLARQERQRLEGLLKEQAVSKKRVIEARNAEQVARAELEAAERRLGQYQRDPGTAGGIPLRAPLDGILVQVQAAPGRYVQEGDPLFHVVSPERLWLEARIAEANVGRMGTPSGAWFAVEGFEQNFDTHSLNGRAVALGGAVDPASRTVPLIFEFDNPDEALRIGMFAQARVVTGEKAQAVAVPRSAIVDDGGQDVVYVMLDGESFERRPLRLGLRDGGWVEVREGLSAGERVVIRGAYLVRLAAASPAEASHGHAH
ncbi:MAG: efflux RND transporter periplasmic adaptor subunit [endosymbiont of Seepiophila jonesi]|uniref:Efflux RND transporter periplasmic adaptor subunit n=1 Tax=endosymbiont of Lamellibrachia luymesi TaxID=2200907 RepID=A0A370DY51_9GAMM|nr:MAG: efflux RND transporter periplasmic adaptor subunit [endosymbiont of Lamellibrachia luymesi]RDH94070.1 MAG: efflux RND transporter periplasmic adaptor subunit [endosymbiont of Seepiophila jonesi]